MSSPGRRARSKSFCELTAGKSPPACTCQPPLAFTANDCLDFGIDLGSPVGLEYYNLAPFRFNGKIEQARVAYTR